MKRGDVILVNLDPTVGHEVKKTRPAVIVSNNLANEYSRLLTIVPITSRKTDHLNRIEVLLDKSCGLNSPSKALVDQIRTIDKARVTKKLGRVNSRTMAEIDERLILHLDLGGIL